MSRNFQRRRRRAGILAIERELGARPHDGHDGIHHRITRMNAIVPPHESLDREFPGILWVEFVRVGKSYESVEIVRSSIVQNSFDREPTAVRNRLAIRWQPYQACVVTIIINF